LQALDLYATIEEYLDFEEEVHHLYKTIGHTVLSKEPKTLIDIGCGQGEFCHIMELNGIKTLGVDLSQKQIDIAVSKGTNAKCIDIKDIDDTFDCATATFDVINYIPEPYIKDFLQQSYNVIKPKGYFIFDINSLYGFDTVAQGTLNIDNDDNFIAIDANFEDNILYTDITLFKKDKNNKYTKESGTIEQYCYSNEKLSSILTDIGFEVENILEVNLHSVDEFDKYIFVCKRGIK
jgi:cyclopropane fatty-acyl-phospholipid synthase-like methyltransferase